MKKISFEYTTPLGELEINRPKPSVKSLPKAYKALKPYTDSKKIANFNAELNHSVKRCIPYLDAMTAGYILTTPADLIVTMQEDKPFIQWKTEQIVLEAHDERQVPDDLKPSYCHDIPFKLINDYVIKTPKGYSCMFLPILNVPNNPFVAVSGIVDTDNFHSPVNFPFFLQKSFTEGVIPAGTPLVQIIPFKRESWYSVFKKSNLKKIAHTKLLLKRKMEFGYKKLFWYKKDFK